MNKKILPDQNEMSHSYYCILSAGCRQDDNLGSPDPISC